jgi:hypothetical protein
MAIIDPVTFDLRSERQGGGDGRVYRVSYVDGAGVTGGSGSVTRGAGRQSLYLTVTIEPEPPII